MPPSLALAYRHRQRAIDTRPIQVARYDVIVGPKTVAARSARPAISAESARGAPQLARRARCPPGACCSSIRSPASRFRSCQGGRQHSEIVAEALPRLVDGRIADLRQIADRIRRHGDQAERVVEVGVEKHRRPKHSPRSARTWPDSARTDQRAGIRTPGSRIVANSAERAGDRSAVLLPSPERTTGPSHVRHGSSAISRTSGGQGFRRS